MPDQLIAILFTTDKPVSVSFRAELRGRRNASMSNYATDYFRMDSLSATEVMLTGKSAEYIGIEGRIRYDARLKDVAEGGLVQFSGVNILAKDANLVTLYFVNATNFINYRDISANDHEISADYLRAIAQKSYEELREAATRNHQELFSRVHLSPENIPASYRPIDERMRSLDSIADPQLVALCYHFSRYILISSSRLGTQRAKPVGNLE